MKSYRSGVLFHNPDKTFDGFTTVAPIRHTASYLINMEGHIVHTWKLPGPLGTKGYIIPNGNFLGSAVTQEGAPIKAAKGGHIFELDWDGNIVWEHIDHNQHHDIRRLENGNTVYLAWEELNQHDVDRVLGGIPGTEKDGKIYGDVIREINFYGDIVWEWKTSDIDFNAFPLAHDCDRSEWAHANAVAPTLDGNILVSFRHLDTIMIIDRKTKKIIWHKRSQEWGHQHDCEMLPNGNIILFANGMNNLKQPLHSRVLEINHATGETIWQFKDPRQWSFFSPNGRRATFG